MWRDLWRVLCLRRLLALIRLKRIMNMPWQNGVHRFGDHFWRVHDLRQFNPGSCVQQISVTVLNGSAALDEGLKAGIVAERVEIGIVLEPCFVSKTKFHRVFETAQGFVGLAQ